MSLKDIIDYVKGQGATYCDIRKERWETTNLTLKDGEMEKVTSGNEEGAMVRVLYNNGWGNIGTSDLSSLKNAAERAISMAKNSNEYKKEKTGMADVETHEEEVEMPMEENFLDVSTEEKVSFLKDLEKKLEKDFVRSTELRYIDRLVDKEIATSDGTQVNMKIPRIVTYLIITGKSDTIQRASEGIGGTGGYELTDRAYEKKDVVLDRLETLLEAETPPSGKMSLIMDPHLTGVFSHEAFGHAAESDLVSTGNSCLEGKIGKKVASDIVTIKDDPTMDGYGSFPFDDEGTKARNRTLVKDGILNDFILDRENAWKLDMEANGGARAEDFRVKPLVRMSNTIMEPGDMEFDELVEEVDKGVYAKSSGGGQVNTGEGTFQFNAQEAYLIEDGEIIKPLRDVSFNGFTLQTLQNITGITKEMDTGIGHCGKGQTAAVTDGGGNVLISEVTVGGRE
ncbi:MAG: TldD/PmbA family protein [Candidatus Thermoplasmatota archaeon]|nr:TldD/PmbA family protein [Candidatus Thermoplasmatota archaeon]MBS3790503.1 TldD/PmbA family protein [Candidatus Thermoplasmatota archaeon]